jgi:hypothetical protein
MTVEQKRLPSIWLCILLSEVEALMGRRSLIKLLRQADLSDYIDHPPPADETPSITTNQYSRLLASTYDLFGAQRARSIFQQSGRLAADDSRKRSGPRAALNGTALRFRSGPKRIEIVLDRLVDQGTEIYGVPHQAEEEDDAFYLEIAQCPYCAEIGRRSKLRNDRIAKPVCHMPVAMLDEMVEWATGQRHLVEEVACMAQGAAACRFRIGK